MGVFTWEWNSMTAGVLMATPCDLEDDMMRKFSTKNVEINVMMMFLFNQEMMMMFITIIAGD